ncbi:hypothetical protein DNTS_033983 [Danionella cerebrum]|uniref:Aquaporin n=1 Tax=Danionella cerebrum TaxID=2873325 RepID=A0A553RAG0_9TELE|nr:hypothetical protein DNTS_033983 [Danionella translucida]
MADLPVSLLLLTGIVVFSELARRTVLFLFPKRPWTIYPLEFISTFQLCACTHELKMLGDAHLLERRFDLTLTFLITVVHGFTFHGAICNPTGALELLCRRVVTQRDTVTRICCQLIAAGAARAAMPFVWALELSERHVLHSRAGFRCTASPVNAPLVVAAAVELSCAFTMHCAGANVGRMKEMYRVPVIAALITTLVYAGGPLTGAVFNPALAFSIQFPCPGNTFFQYSTVYWMGPILGMFSSLLLFDKLIPALSGKRSNTLDFNGLQKEKKT